MYTKLFLLVSAFIATYAVASNNPHNNEDELQKALRLSQQEYEQQNQNEEETIKQLLNQSREEYFQKLKVENEKKKQLEEEKIIQESLKSFEEQKKKVKLEEEMIKIISLNEHFLQQQKEEDELLQQAILLSLDNNSLQVEDDLQEEELNIIENLTPINVATLFEQVDLGNAHTHTFNNVSGYAMTLTMRQNKPILTIFNNPEQLTLQAIPGGNDQEKSYKICLQSNPTALGILTVKKN